MRQLMVCVGGARDGESFMAEGKMREVVALPQAGRKIVPIGDPAELTVTYDEYEVTAIFVGLGDKRQDFYFLKPRGSDEGTAVLLLLQEHGKR